jgi:2-polyprenyl-3-methyl-5-hydroxy-6-metoxy-1,4-benzoquinol methylase
MSGGWDAALERGASEVAEFGSSPGLAIDLGAGFGMHALPLARAGWRVVAVDSSAELLSNLRESAIGLSVTTIEQDLLTFAHKLGDEMQADLILCMGDTLMHLGSEAQLEGLSQATARSLTPQGVFVATFRDYTHLPEGNARFIPVRSDAQRILTCFLEDAGDHVRVHDVLHELRDGAWQMRMSSYLKIRTSPARVQAIFERAGMHVTLEPGLRGMIRLTARSTAGVP